MSLRELERAIIDADEENRNQLLKKYIEKTLGALVKLGKMNKEVMITFLIKNLKAYNHALQFIAKWKNEEVNEILNGIIYSLMILIIEYFKSRKKCDQSIQAMQFLNNSIDILDDVDLKYKLLYNQGILFVKCGYENLGKEYIESAKKLKS